jgi:bacteriocin biosynthesis cyclodehydratase domain-containing protein
VIRPRLAPGFTTLIDAGSLWLVAGEDVRYRLTARDPRWLRELIARCDGSRTLDELATAHDDARATLERLYEERVLVDGTAAQAHVAIEPAAIELFMQDSLDHRALLAKNGELLASRRRWMWITTGPGARAYVGPLFVPGAGPCAQCLLVHFKRLSPVPELYDVLIAHDGPIAATPFVDAARQTVDAFVRWKLSLASAPLAVPALYALHVIETSELTITSHVPLADVECTACR